MFTIEIYTKDYRFLKLTFKSNDDQYKFSQYLKKKVFSHEKLEKKFATIFKQTTIIKDGWKVYENPIEEYKRQEAFSQEMF